jgi:hypothetical protein
VKLASIILFHLEFSFRFIGSNSLYLSGSIGAWANFVFRFQAF